MTLLTPLCGLAALAAGLVLGATLLAHGRAEAVRAALRLPRSESHTLWVRAALATAGVVLLGLAAAQPALTRTSSSHVRRTVQAVFVLDTSRSMAASSSPRGRTRLDRAIAAAILLRDGIPDVESGVLTLTDRVLPDLLPVADREGFAGVAGRAVRIESPPPRSASVRATSYSALGEIPRGNSFAPSARLRIVVLLTDGESSPVQTGELAHTLSPRDGYRFLALRFWSAGESVYGPDGKAEAAYRPDPSGRATLRDLAVSLGGRSFDEAQVAAARAYLRTLAERGPTMRATGAERRRVTLAPYLALAGLVALLALLAPSFPAPSAIRSALR
jgi:hypothetical protein